MTKLWRSTFDENGKRQIEDIKALDISYDKPTVVFFSGFSTITKWKGFIGGALKSTEKMLGLNKQEANKIQIITGSYKGLSQFFNLLAYNRFPNNYCSSAGKKAARDIILPRVAQNIVLKKNNHFKSAEKLPLDEAKERLRNLTLVGYSMGTVITQEMYNASKQFMRKIGYTREETQELLSEVVLLSMGTMSRPTKEKNRFKTIFMVASNDDVVRKRAHIHLRVKEHLARQAKKFLKITPWSNTGLYISAPVKPRLIETVIDENGQEQKKHIPMLYPKWTGFNSHHELPHYITNNDEDNDFSKIVSVTLANAINRNEDTTITDLVTNTQSFVDTNNNGFASDEIESYNNRIAKALTPKQAIKL